MKTKLLLLIITIIAIASYAFQINEPWTRKQLMEPAVLANILNNPAEKQPILFSIGPGGGIKSSLDIGQTKEKENIEKLRKQLNNLSRDTMIVIYCGCCPFKDCPNIRPAFQLLNEMKFTNTRLLDLSKNLKADWIDKGYPINN